jgi:hypothetical protein
MHSKRAASRAASQEETASDDGSGGGDEQFIIAPRPSRAVKKTRAGASSSRTAAEDADVAEGRGVREARESGLIQKVEHPVQPDYEYTLRRVDHHHPHRPTDFRRGENQSMINRDENPYDWITELYDHRFWNNFQADWYHTVIKNRKNPITSQLYVD